MSITGRFQDGIFVRGPVLGGPPMQCPPPTVRTVDVSMETLVSTRVCGAASSYQQNETQHRSVYGGLCSPPEATIKLSPHLHRNQQLQDTLQQREEELARLQQENDKLRHFLSSSFVRNLEEKVKGLSSNHRSNLKRSLQQDHRTDQNLCSSRSNPAPQHFSKRICRNLFPEFCCDPAPLGEPNLDLWVLQTLGLKDRDTIDPSASPSSFRLPTPPHPSSSSISSLTPPHPSSSHFSAQSSCEASAILPDLPPTTSSSSSGFVLTSTPDRRDLSLSASLQQSHILSANANMTATQHRDTYHHHTQCTEISDHQSAMTTESYHPNTALLAPLTQGPQHPNTALLAPLTQGPQHPNTALLAPLTQGPQHPNTALLAPLTQGPQHSNTALLAPLSQGPQHPNTALLAPLTQGLSQTIGITPGHPGHSSGSASGPNPPTHSPQSIQLSPIPTSGLINQTFTTMDPSSHAPTPTPGAVPSFQMLTPPHTPRGHKDVVFRGSLSPSSSFKTHSFPQGQAFIRKDTLGCWSFTWIPKQGA